MVDTTRRKFLGAALGAATTTALPKVKVIPKAPDELPADIAELIIRKGHPLRRYAGADALRAEFDSLLDSWVPKGMEPRWQPLLDKTMTEQSPAADAAMDALWKEGDKMHARLVDLARRGDPKAYRSLRSMGLDHEDIRDALRSAHVSLSGNDPDPSLQSSLVSRWGNHDLWMDLNSPVPLPGRVIGPNESWVSSPAPRVSPPMSAGLTDALNAVSVAPRIDALSPEIHNLLRTINGEAIGGAVPPKIKQVK